MLMRDDSYVVGYICSSKLIPLSQYIGTALVCLIGVTCLRGDNILLSLYIYKKNCLFNYHTLVVDICTLSTFILL